MPTITLPQRNYNATQAFGPVALANGLQGFSMLVKLHTTADPINFADPAQELLVVIERSYDGGNTWEAPLKWNQVGGIHLDRDGQEQTHAYFAATCIPSPTHLKGELQILNGPLTTQLTVEYQ